MSEVVERSETGFAGFSGFRLSVVMSSLYGAVDLLVELGRGFDSFGSHSASFGKRRE
jgi:hypothetical protein